MNTGNEVVKRRPIRRGGKKKRRRSIPIIPEDIIAWEILPKLPTKSLLRFRSVCKSWYSLITYDSDFHTLHAHNLECNRGSNNGMESNRRRRKGRGKGSHWIILDRPYRCPFAGGVNLYDEYFRFGPKPVPNNMFLFGESVSSWDSRIIGSCNGVVCFYFPIDEETTTMIFGEGSFLCICNPCIRKSKRVDIPWRFPPFKGSIFMMMMGFGYASLSSDYKVVMITKDVHEGDHVHVYSLRSNCWKRFRTRLPAPRTDKCLRVGTYFNEACHWVCEISGDHKLVCFDLNTERLRFIKLPQTIFLTELPSEYAMSRCYDNLQILVYKDMLCIWFIYMFTPGCYTVQVWGMTEHGNSKSWTSVLHVCIDDNGPKHLLNSKPKLFGIDSHGSLLLFGLIKVVSYNPESKESKILKMFHSSRYQLTSYKESLALIDLDCQTDFGHPKHLDSVTDLDHRRHLDYEPDYQTNLGHPRRPNDETDLAYMRMPRSVLWSFAFTCLLLQAIILFPLTKS